MAQQRRPPRRRPGAPIVRRGTVRLAHDVARKVRGGHPWIYKEALGNRSLRENPGDPIELVDADGEFVARGIFDGEGAIAVRVVTRNPSEHIDTRSMAYRARKAVELRRRFVDFDAQQAMRVINAESDGLPAFTVDRYDRYLVAHLFTAALERYRDAIYDALEAELRPAAIYEQRRYRSLAGDAPRHPGELVRGAPAPVELEVREGELKFWVDVTAPLSTGLFPDLRLGRAAIARWARGRRVLNLFSYTGAISVYAAHGGAAEVVAVDVAAKAHARARKNFALNGLDPEKPEHIVGDAFKVLARFAERGRLFDLVAIDPPAFASAGKGRAFSFVRDAAELITEALRVLAPGGLLAVASSTHRMTRADFETALADGALRAGRELRIIERQGLPVDFPVTPGFLEGSYLKFAIAAAD